MKACSGPTPEVGQRERCAMSKSSANAEPSMEEILASIRQIISDEDAPGENEAPKEAEPVADEAEAEADGDGETMSEADLDALFADTPPAGDDAGEEDSSDPADDAFDAAALAEAEFDAPAMADDDEGDADETAGLDGEEDDEDVLDLGSLPEMSDEPFDPPSDLDFAEPEPEPEPEIEPEPELDVLAPAPVQTAPEPQPVAEPRLLSQDADQAVSAAFANLANTMLSGNARTLEDLVQDMLRPMLKSWLDENLPTMVEKMVREEIERVARRGPRP